VETILGSVGFLQALEAKQIEVEHVTSAKQTDTTQRWKIGIRLAGGVPLPTKIEFSRRKGINDELLLEPVDPGLISSYGLYAVISQHYSKEAAFRQKIVALSRRAETQARDVFDLKLLIDSGAGKNPLPDDVAHEVPAAVEKAMSIGYDEFSGQVRAFLDANYQDFYGSRNVWESLRQEVIDTLTEVSP